MTPVNPLTVVLTKFRQWLERRRRLVRAVIVAALLTAGFYGLENLRCRLVLDAAVKAAVEGGVPQKVAGIWSPSLPAGRNLFLSRVVQNRLIVTGEFQRFQWADSPVPVFWGEIQPRSVKIKEKGLWRTVRVDTSPADGRRRDLQAVRDAMARLGWTLPEGSAPAEAVLGGLERFRVELGEWAAEIRKRPDWAVTEEYAAHSQTLGKLLPETQRIFSLRALAAAETGRPAEEVLRDLESAALLGRNVLEPADALNNLIWELLRTRRLNDAEWKQAGELLPDGPKTQLLLKSIYTSDLAEEVWRPREIPAFLGGGGESLMDSVLGTLQPSGWHLLVTAHEVRADLAAKNWLEATDAAWREGKPLPSKPDFRRSWWAWGGAVFPRHEYPFRLGAHLMSCGCQWGSMIQGAMESRLAMAAIGLERFRLRHGVWPETLEAARDFLPGGLRNNPVTGNPFVYKLLPDGGWMIQADGDWSTSWRSALPPA